MRHIALVSALAVLPVTVEAQPVDSFQQLEELVDPEVDVTVTYGSGEVVRGRAVDISPSGLTLMTAGAKLDLAESDIQRIRQRWNDPTRDGALIGFAFGTAPWLVLWDGMIGDLDTRKDVAGMVMVTGLSGVAGMLLGATVDGGKRREREIYRAPASPGEPSAGRGARIPFEVAGGVHVGAIEQPVHKRSWLVSGGFQIGSLNYVAEVAWARRTDLPGGALDIPDVHHAHLLTMAGGIRHKPVGERRLTPFYQILAGGATATNTYGPGWEFSGWPDPRRQFLLQPGAGLDVEMYRRLTIRVAADLMVLTDRHAMTRTPRMSVRVVVGF